MPRHQLIQYKDNCFALLSPAPASRLETLDFLLGCLVNVWEQSGFDTQLLMQPNFWQIACAIADLIPSHPILRLDMGRVADDPFLFQYLFLRDKTGDKSIIQKLHSFEPLTKQEKLKPGENIQLKHLPFPTSGDSSADILSGILYSMGLGDGLRMWDRFDSETLDRLSNVLAELNRPEDERIKEFILAKKLEWEFETFGDDPDTGFLDQLNTMQEQMRSKTKKSGP